MTLVHAACEGMHELDFARLERERLSRIVENSGCPSLRQRLVHATDPLELHILHGYAVTTGSAYGYSAPSRDECFQLFTAIHDLKDNNTCSIERWRPSASQACTQKGKLVGLSFGIQPSQERQRRSVLRAHLDKRNLAQRLGCRTTFSHLRYVFKKAMGCGSNVLYMQWNGHFVGS